MSPSLANVFGYPDAVWRRFVAPAHAGAFAAGEPGVISAQAATPAARFVVRLALKLADGRVQTAKFLAYGCPVTIAVGEWLAEQAPGRSIQELAAIDAPAIRAALEIPDERAHCAVLGEALVRNLVKQVS